MKHFFRSLEYLKAHRGRLAVSFLAVLLIGVLWSGSITMALPVLKVLFSAEGLHGWAYNTMVSDRLNAKIAWRTAPPNTVADGRNLSLVLDVVSVEPTGSAAESKLRNGDWIIGLAGEGRDPAGEVLRADVLVGQLAHWAPSARPPRLLVYRPTEDITTTISVPLGLLEFKSKTLGYIAEAIPEPNSRRERTSILFWLLGVVVAMVLLRNLMRFVQEYLVQTSVHLGMWSFRNDCFDNALRQPVTYFASAGTSDTASRFMQDSTELARAQTTLFGKTLVEPAKMVGSVIAALLLNWQLALMAMIGGPIAYAIIRQFGKRMKKSTRGALESWAEMLGVLEETLQGLRVVKAYTMEASERKRFHRVNRTLYKQIRRIVRIDSATSPTVEVLGMSAGMVAAGVAGVWVLENKMDPEIFMTTMGLLMAMFDPVRKLSKVLVRFQAGDAAAERLYELRDRPRETRTVGAPNLPRHQKSIEYRDIRFAYPNVAEPTLREINLTVTAGQAVAIVGPNGSGKTTLVSLLPRLLEPTGGQILLDGQDIMAHSMRSLRRQIAIVTQETVIFNATIAENIAYGLRRAKHATILDAAQRAYVDEFVRDMPDGYDTVVGQRGATLSGGQRQRLAIARAILRDPAILIFDEALSQIDADSEKKIHAAMQDFMADRTTLMIAHRFSTVLDADAIVVLDEGRIVDTGPHKDLMDRCELYRQLYNTQFAAPQG
jgi:ATP-binding cassette, subfamily B, bacterial MsbA